MENKTEKASIKPIDVDAVLSGYHPGREEYFAAIGHLLREVAVNNSVIDEDLAEMERIVRKLHDSRDFKARSRKVIAATIFWWVTAKSPRAKKFWKQKEIAEILGVSEAGMRQVLKKTLKFLTDDREW
jgi:hypothetical protein